MGSQRKTNEQFLRELHEKNPSVKPIDPYIGGHQKITFECVECGNRWQAEPVRILAGRGCPSCRRKRISQSKTRTNAWFVEQMQKANPSIEPLEEYRGSSIAIKCRCLTCGEEFFAKPQVLLAGGLCPACYRAFKARKYRKTNARFLEELAKKNPTVEPLQEYQTAVTRIRCRCRTCGHEWEAVPTKLLNGSKCPACNKRCRKTPRTPSMTPAEFKQKLEAINPLVVPLEEFEKKSNKMAFRCAACGHEWMATPTDVLRGRGCIECGRKRAGESRRKTNDQFRKELSMVNPDIEPLEEYRGGHTKILCRCNSCGTIWKAEPSGLLYGYGCRACGIKAAGEKRRKSHAAFVNEMSVKNPKVEVIEEYTGNKAKILVRCKKCGFEWKGIPSDLLSGKGCRKCRDRDTSARMKKSPEAFANELAQKNPEIELLEQYADSKTPLKCRCTACGNVWYTTPTNLLSGRSCPICAVKRRAAKRTKTNDEFLIELKEINPSIEPLEDYSGAAEDLRVRCLGCGYEWIARPTNLLHGNGCPRCARSGTSFMELVILGICNAVYGEENVTWHDKSLIGKELDILIPKENQAIEFGSWAWHKDKLADDKRKREECNDANCVLLTIYDACPLDSPPFDEETCWVYSEDMGLVYKLPQLNEFAKRLLEYLGHVDAQIDMASIRKEAQLFSKRMSTDQFKERVSEVNPDIEVLGHFTRQKDRILCRCKKCGKEWSPIAETLLKGHGCKPCNLKKSWSAGSGKSGRRKRTPDEFRAEIETINPNILVLGSYQGQSERVLCKCTKCGREWHALPGNLLKGSGCKTCGYESSRAKQIGTTEQFIQELEKIDSSIEVIGEYAKSDIPILVKCKLCGYEWKSSPQHLKSGRGCWMCAHKAKNKPKWRKTK